MIKTRDGGEGEAEVRGRASLQAEPSRLAAVCRDIGEVMLWKPEPDRVELFRVDVESATVVRYAENGDQHVALRPQRRRRVRRATSATSVGNLEDVTSF